MIKFVTPDEFKSYETIAYTKGFLMVSSTPLTRSSHHAGEDFARLKAARDSQAMNCSVLIHRAGFEKRHPVRHSAENMFALVADVERYPEFVPLCEALTVTSRREKGDKTMLLADMTVGYKAIRETFTSQVMLDPAQSGYQCSISGWSIQVSRQSLEFRFEAMKGLSRVDFLIDYEFKSKMLGLLMGSMFETAFQAVYKGVRKARRSDLRYR